MLHFLAGLLLMRDVNPLTAGLIDRLAPVAVAAATLWLAFVWVIA
jgi:hypothetical protein